MGNSAPLILDAETIAIYRDSFTIFVQAHQSIAEFGGQMTFDVAPGGDVLQVNARRNLGKVKVERWQSVKNKSR
jgi:hypothetical protein